MAKKNEKLKEEWGHVQCANCDVVVAYFPPNAFVPDGMELFCENCANEKVEDDGED